MLVHTPQNQGWEVRTQISDAEIAAVCDPKIILPLIQLDLAHRITDMAMERLGPKLQAAFAAMETPYGSQGHD